jgi:hypothetical protein
MFQPYHFIKRDIYIYNVSNIFFYIADLFKLINILNNPNILNNLRIGMNLNYLNFMMGYTASGMQCPTLPWGSVLLILLGALLEISFTPTTDKKFQPVFAHPSGFFVLISCRGKNVRQVLPAMLVKIAFNFIL